MSENIYLRKGDITQAKVDAIVNAANTTMLGGGGVDGAIHRAAGPELLAACTKVAAVEGIRCPTGCSRITTAGKLSARFVIHTVGPRYQIDFPPETLLASCYQSSLALALQNQCSSIAFPAISCGVYGYPIAQAAEIAIEQCQAAEWSSLNIYFYLYNEKIFTIWQNALANVSG